MCISSQCIWKQRHGNSYNNVVYYRSKQVYKKTGT